jgi:hypothetical protein
VKDRMPRKVKKAIGLDVWLYARATPRTRRFQRRACSHWRRGMRVLGEVKP